MDAGVPRQNLVQQPVRTIRLDLDPHHAVGEQTPSAGAGPRPRSVFEVDHDQRQLEVDR